MGLIHISKDEFSKAEDGKLWVSVYSEEQGEGKAGKCETIYQVMKTSTRLEIFAGDAVTIKA